jgi:RNA polymerase sigma-70 factor (ECF subfamily)
VTEPVDRQTAVLDVEVAYRAVRGQAVATLVRVFGDITVAEDAVQDAFMVASERWVLDGVPPNPAGWIITTAKNRAIDQARRAKRGAALQEMAAADMNPTSDPFEHWSGDAWDDLETHDDQLRLIFTCCHPSLHQDHRVALTLRLVGGLSVEEIARAFLISEPAMAKRLVRAKYKIKAANIPYRVPKTTDLPERLRSVLSVLYLIYNAGLDSPEAASLRADAKRMARSLAGLMPDEPEVAGLLALMLLSEARADARTVDGEIVLLADQDRSKWDGALIAEGEAIVLACVRRNQPGPYQIQASIQATHDVATRYEDTDWPQIVGLYDHLLLYQDTAMVRLNRAIAFAEAFDPAIALREVDQIAPSLDSYHLLHATRGTLLRRVGREAESSAAFRRAAELAPTEPQRRFLESV